MKTKFTFLTFLIFATITFSQKQIEASDIMKDIKNGKSISYKNATIVGVLDFTYMDEALEKQPKRKKKSWWSNINSSNTVKKIIDVQISFKNCTFKDDVLAYFPHKDSGYTFIANFEDKVIFTNCNFERKAMFKFSRFERDTDFSGATFDDDTTFKFSKFLGNISFSNSKFAETATFKHAKFNENVSFSNSVFEESAVFKYTEFKNGVSFKSTNFEEDLNIKYMNVRGDFNITDMKVGYEIDSKYTKINGRSFNKSLLENKN